MGALADTAQLAVELRLKDGLTGPLKKVNGEVSRLNTTTASSGRGVSVLSGGFARAGKAADGMKGAVGHLGERVKSLATGPLGLIGLGAGLFTVAGAMEQSIGKASELGLTVEKLTSLTGDSAEHISALVAVFEKFGVGTDKTTRALGFLEKNVGLMAVNTKLAKKFTDQFGFSIRDAGGHVKDANTLILQAADYWTSNASQAKKAALESKLFGRSYADLIPVLALGSKGIKDAEEEAAQLGLVLNKTNVQDLARFRSATREAGDAVGGLKLQIGLALIPTITDLAKSVSSFVREHRTDIVDFFRSALVEGKKLAGFVTGTVIPTLRDLAGTARTFWDSVPAPLRDLITKGVIADRAISFLFGISPIKIAVDFATGALEKGIGGLVGSLFQRGGTPANPLFVADVTGGLGKIGGAAAEGAAGLSAGAIVLGVGAAAAIGAAIAIPVANAIRIIAGITPEQAAAQNSKGQFGPRSQDNVTNPSAPLPTLGEHALDRTVAAVNKANALLGRGIQEGHRDTDKLSSAFGRGDLTIQVLLRAAQKDDRTHRDFHSMLEALGKLTKASDIKSSADKLTHELTHGIGGIVAGNKLLADLQRQQKAAIASGNTKLAKSLGVDIHKVEAALPGKAFSAKELHTAESILNSTKSSHDQIAALRKIQADLKAHGDTKAAGIIAAAIRKKKMSTTVTVNNRISTRISVSAKQLHDYVVTYQRAGAIVGNKV